MTNTRILMCAPDHFDVAYVINPWMEGNVAHCDPLLAMRQWQELMRAIGSVASVDMVRGAQGLPDMVFTANAGLVVGDQVVLSRFRHAERSGEEALFRHWFEQNGYRVEQLPEGVYFEGAGDALLDRHESLLWLGYGHRSDAACASALSEMLGIETLSLRLVDPRFYHLDTCFCPLDGGELMFFPQAFDDASLRRIEIRVPAERRIAVDTEDAQGFACNAVSVGRDIFLNHASPDLRARLEERDYRVHVLPLSEFMKAGGAAKCLTLRLTEPRPKGSQKAPEEEEAVA